MGPKGKVGRWEKKIRKSMTGEQKAHCERVKEKQVTVENEHYPWTPWPFSLTCVCVTEIDR